MGKIILVTGGARSGKSNFAESLAKNYNLNEVIYIATSLPIDEEMKDRIKKHRLNRPSNWQTIENYSEINHIITKNSYNKFFLIDCVTIMINNLMFDFNLRFDQPDSQTADKVNNKILNYIKEIIIACKAVDATILFVTNEIGMGIVPGDGITRLFRDIAGRTNQILAQNANEVYFCVSGIPIKIK